MAVFLNKIKDELIVTCNCGCEDALHIKINSDDNEYFSFLSYMNGNFYKEQYHLFDRIKVKLKKIWAIITNKDYYYSDVIMTKEDFEQFKEYINQFITEASHENTKFVTVGGSENK